MFLRERPGGLEVGFESRESRLVLDESQKIREYVLKKLCARLQVQEREPSVMEYTLSLYWLLMFVGR